MMDSRDNNRGLTRKIAQAVEKTPGINIYVEDVMQDFNVTRQAADQAMYRAMRILPGLVRVAGGVYKYVPGSVKKESDNKLFEQIGVTKTGVLVLQDEEGNLYRAEEIK